MKIAVACGGTGGHIFPGLATAQALMQRGHDVTLWLAGKDVENEAVRGWPGRVITVPAQGFPSGLSPKALVTAVRLLRAIGEVKTAMRAERPEVVLAMGSYASVGPVGAAIRLGIPVVLHESNVIPGRAVRLLARWARVVGTCFDETRFYLRRRRLEVTGMPLRNELVVAAGQAREPGPVPRLLVMGGSRGAHRLNEITMACFGRLAADGLRFSVTHLTGEADEELVRTAYAASGIDADVQAFTRDMGRIYLATDLAICRAGAATCAELSVFGIPALLVPYPHAIHDHQTANARAMEKTGAADWVPESDITEAWLGSYIRDLVRGEERRRRMAMAARARSTGDGAERLADLVERAARGALDARA
jgi:UDP-N-acetylglucosamine--N-acetylmuramyl-(pentapeptide) pyrophosphoryl-undecaprenol N-acetylglucosamine transferase